MERTSWFLEVIVVKKRVRRGLASVLVILVLTSLTLLILALTGLYMAASPRRRAEAQLTRLATSYAKLSEVNSFAIFNGTETYYSILGRDDNQEEVLVLLAEGQDQPELIKLTGKLNREQIEALALNQGVTPERLSFGRYQDHDVWEVTSQNQYYLFDAETGDLLAVWG